MSFRSSVVSNSVAGKEHHQRESWFVSTAQHKQNSGRIQLERCGRAAVVVSLVQLVSGGRRGDSGREKATLDVQKAMMGDKRNGIRGLVSRRQSKMSRTDPLGVARVAYGCDNHRFFRPLAPIRSGPTLQRSNGVEAWEARAYGMGWDEQQGVTPGVM